MKCKADARTVGRLVACAIAALSCGCDSVPSRYQRPFDRTIAARRSEPDPFENPSPDVQPPVAPEESGNPGDSAGASAPAERPRLADSTRRRIELRGMPLSEALHLIASMAEVNVYLDAGFFEPVDASFPSATLDEALGVLLTRHQLTLVEDPPGIFWVVRDDGSQIALKSFELRSVGGADVIDNLRGLVSGATSLVLDRNLNFLVARGPERDLELVETYLASADRLKQQVLIEVEILEVLLTDHFELGVQNLLSDSNFLGEISATLVQDFSTSGQDFTGILDLNDASVTTTINALENYGLVNVLSSPRVLAITNTQSKIEVITEIPYIEATTSISSTTGGQGTTSQQSIAFKEAGIKMTVQPVVQAGGVVQLSIDQEFSEVVDRFLGIPVLDSRQIISQFLVNDRETVVLGGLMQAKKSEADRGAPLLMHLPLIGRLFRSDDDTTTRRELLVLLTPRIVDPTQAATLASQYKSGFSQRARAAGSDEAGD